MTTNQPQKSLTLGQIQEALDTPQHVLIHLCEKEVIMPDFSDTDGRGKARLFSQANLIEFAVALQIRKFQIPVMATKAIMKVLKKFSEYVRRKKKGFSLVNLVKDKPHPQFIIYIDNGEDFIFSLRFKNDPSYMNVKCSMSAFSQNKALRFVILSELSKNYVSRLEINISKIIADLGDHLDFNESYL